MRGRLFNLFRLFCVVVSTSLSFSFADLLPSLLSSFVDEPRRGFNGDARGFCPGAKRPTGRFKFSRDVGLGTIEDDFSTGFSSSVLFSASSLDSVVDTVDAPLRPRLRRLNCGRGFNNRDTVELSGSAGFSVVLVVG